MLFKKFLVYKTPFSLRLLSSSALRPMRPQYISSLSAPRGLPRERIWQGVPEKTGCMAGTEILSKSGWAMD